MSKNTMMSRVSSIQLEPKLDTSYEERFFQQLELEKLYDKNQLMPRVREAFRENEINFVGYLEQEGIHEKFGIDLLAQMAVRKRAPANTVIGILRHHFGDTQRTAQELELAVEKGLVEAILTEDGDIQIVVIYEISKEIQDDLDRYQFPLPMIIPPMPIKDNLDTGYLTQKGSVILRDNHTRDDVYLEALNRLNSMPLQLNMEVVQTISNKWRNHNKMKPNESWEDFRARQKAFEKYDRTSKDVMATLLNHSQVLYLTHKYDKRGRSYCVGYHVNYQGNDWNKAVIEFAEEETLNEE